MTFDEFRLHRTKLALSLVEFVDGRTETIVSVLPEYDDHELFSALIMPEGDRVGQVAVCCSPNHPAAMREEEGPGVPTWWWESDLE